MSFTTTSAVFALAPLAGPDYETKATIGLGLGLPVEDYHTSFDDSRKSMVGLGLYLDFENSDGVLVALPIPSARPYDDVPSPVSSPPMLEARRARRAPSPDSLWGEYTPLRTPSPRVMAQPPLVPPGLWVPGQLQHSVPNDPEEQREDEPESTMSTLVYTLPTSEGIASGLNLLALDEQEMMAYVPPEVTHAPDAGVGLGLSLAELEGPELVFTLREHGLLDTSEYSTTYAFDDPPSSPPPLPHLVGLYDELERLAQPTPRRAHVGLGLLIEDGRLEVIVEEEDDSDVVEVVDEECGSASSETSVDAPAGLGFDSPFWETYTATIAGEL